MSFITIDIASVSATDFDWYLVFVESPFQDGIREDMDKNFLTLGREAGKGVLAIRGYDKLEIPEFFNRALGNRIQPPCLLVMNRPPADLVDEKKKGAQARLEAAKLIIFPLTPIFEQDGTLSKFFGNLVNALKSRDALEALEQLDGTKLQKAWGWLSKYVKMEPGFWGFKLKLNDVMRDALGRKSSAST
jgi:hypothetical protein